MSVLVRKDRCIGCGFCVNTEDEVFSFGEDGLAEANNSKITDENIENVETAIEGCPVEAIVKNEKVDNVFEEAA